MKEKEVLLITNSFPTKSFKRSGIFAYDDYLSLLEKGIRVKIIILFRITFEKRNFLNPYSQYKKNKIQIKEIREAISNLPNIELITYFSLIKPIVFKEDLFLFKDSKFKNNLFDSIIVHSMLHTGLNISWIRKQFPNQEITLKEHSDWLLFNKMVRYFCLKKINLYTTLFANSGDSKNKMETLFNKHKKIVLFPPKIRIDYPKFFVNKVSCIKENIPFKFITVANLIKAKGYEEAFEIMKIVNNNNFQWSWIIVGKGPFKKKIEELIILNGFDKNVTIIDELSKKYLYKEFEKSNIYVQLSYMETFGIAPIEGFSFFNKLIISNKIESIRELGLENNSNIFIINDINKIHDQEGAILKFFLEKSDISAFTKAISFIENQINN